MLIRRSSLGLLATIGILVAGSTFGAAAASAEADPTSDPSVSMTELAGGDTVISTDQMQILVEAPEGPLPSDEELQALAPVASCSMQVHYPHNSSHVPGTINVVGDITCTVNMTSIALRVDLERLAPNGVVYAGQQQSVFTDHFLEANRAISCYAGTYRGYATGTVEPLPGYVLESPATQSENGFSRSITCGNSASAVDDVASVVTFDFVRADLAATNPAP